MSDEEKNYVTTIEFALHPTVSLRVSLHKSIPTNPHNVVNQLFAIPNNSNSEKFAIFDAQKVVSLEQIAIAANTALLRRFQFEQKNGISRRGIALETILCCAGSTNTATVLRDYAFDQNSTAATKEGTGCNGNYDVFCLGFCESDEEFIKVISSVGLGKAANKSDLDAHLSRKRNEQEMKDLMKAYKVTPAEVDFQGSSLEKGVANRVAAKFHT